jgi:hypothetical protein
MARILLPSPVVRSGAAGRSVDGGALERALRARVDGEVRFDAGSRAAYSTDASNYRQTPIGVVAPRSIAAAVEAVAVCRQHGAPLLSRGGGTSLAGECTNAAVVLDFSKYCNRLRRPEGWRGPVHRGDDRAAGDDVPYHSRRETRPMSAPGPTPAQEPRTPGERPRRAPADPPPMSVAEKLACEWEARHDVAARRRIADVAPVQHYLTHARSEDGRNASAGAGRRAARGESPAPSSPSAQRVSPALRSWLRWGEDGGPENPVIPRC